MHIAKVSKSSSGGEGSTVTALSSLKYDCSKSRLSSWPSKPLWIVTSLTVPGCGGELGISQNGGGEEERETGR